ncbi:sulfite exporter TauE/SafE family protein [Methylomicrobium sp. RS1]|uniref:sulfite exporter TauE/SafE family protein n=1 Tax=Candidatus Methylomicrobium oryzae TaxID=2802053 RepID=UPI0019243B1A|nr:sulfite exporter TauE/SafE family protein [Methylomicrobium sp. RS1]MBL1265741.1 sulfite exporter TauE/SafE family protein [Methylomicrobium sp. RS1]
MDHSMMDHAAMGHGAMQGMAEAASAAGGFDYTLAFIAGFLGSGHCLGMCGALVSGYFMNAGKQRSYWPYLSYQVARISVYGLIGVAAALLGVVLVAGGVFGKIQSILQMLIGLVVTGLAFGILGWLPWQGSLRLLPLQWLRKGYAVSRRQGPLGGALLAGLLNGMMPCPLTFAMAVKATTAPSVLGGGSLMLAFGAGTLPMMLFISLAFGRINAGLRGMMYKAAAMIMVVMGINTFYRGLSFYLDQNFKHHNHYIMLQAWVNKLMAYLHQLVAYFGDLVGNIQNM